MLASSLFVLCALTLTGFYVKERNNVKQNKENSVDFSKWEQDAAGKADEIGKQIEDNGLEEQVKEANVKDAVNPSMLNTDEGRYLYNGVPIPSEEGEDEDNGLEEDKEDTEEDPQQDTRKETIANHASISFGKEDELAWPVTGNVIINYSMDKTVYFSTLNQYRYNPALVIAANEGERVVSAADGIVKQVYYDTKLGNCIEMDLGDGYKLKYGQLKDISVKEGDYVNKGTMLGMVATPTKYFSQEGCNTYFEMTQNEEPINPLNRLP